ncbi:MAG TPA: T9SS type A sorting domain-containing protein, partial [Bacteroidales bacterium]|nr:T9SS type A sorting domain-containing protein [Bacteroidales bacterium]
IPFVLHLYADGRIEFYYGDLEYGDNKFYSGIFRGDDRNFVLTPAHNKSSSVASNRNFRFIPPPYIRGINISKDGIPSGAVMESMQMRELEVACFDNNEVLSTEKIWITANPGRRENPDTTEVKVYPIPTTGLIEFYGIRQTISQISIFDLKGATLITVTGQNKRKIEIDLSHLSSGIYFYEVTLENGRKNKGKLIKL